MRTHRAVPLLVLVVTLALTACGGGTDDTAIDAPTSPLPTEIDQPPEDTETGEVTRTEPYDTLVAAADQAGPQGTAQVLTRVFGPVTEANAVEPSPRYAELIAALEDHVYLSAAAVFVVLDQGPDAPGVEAALGAVRDNATDLANAIGVAGFADTWMEQVDAILAATTSDDAQPLVEALDSWRDEVAAALADAPGAAGAAAIREQLVRYLDAYQAFIDLASEVPHASTYHQLMETTNTLVDAPDGLVALLVPETDEPTALHGRLTSLLREHVLLVGLMAQASALDGFSTETVQEGALTALEDNSSELTALVGERIPTAREDFYAAWTRHVEAEAAFAAAFALDRDEALNEALTRLRDVPSTVGDVLAPVADGPVDADEIATVLTDQFAATQDAIEAFVVTYGR